jgi:hypothetical protein
VDGSGARQGQERSGVPGRGFNERGRSAELSTVFLCCAEQSALSSPPAIGFRGCGGMALHRIRPLQRIRSGCNVFGGIQPEAALGINDLRRRPIPPATHSGRLQRIPTRFRECVAKPWGDRE